MNGNGAMGPDSWGAQATSRQDASNPPPPPRRTLSIPGGLPPSITPPPPVAQFGATPASQITQTEKNEDAPFPELGRAGSVLGWLVSFVSPRAPTAATSPSAGSASTAEAMQQAINAPPVNPPAQGYPFQHTIQAPPTILQSQPAAISPQQSGAPPHQPAPPHQQFNAFSFGGNPPPLNPPNPSSQNPQWGPQANSNPGANIPAAPPQANNWSSPNAPPPPGNSQAAGQASQQPAAGPWGPPPPVVQPAAAAAQNFGQQAPPGGQQPRPAVSSNPIGDMNQLGGFSALRISTSNQSGANELSQQPEGQGSPVPGARGPEPPQPRQLHPPNFGQSQFAGGVHAPPPASHPPPQLQSPSIGAQQAATPGSQPSRQPSGQGNGQAQQNPLFQIPEPPMPNQQQQQNWGQQPAQGNFQFQQPNVPQPTPPRPPQGNQPGQPNQGPQAGQQGGHPQVPTFQSQGPNPQGQANLGRGQNQSQPPNPQPQAPQPLVPQPHNQQGPPPGHQGGHPQVPQFQSQASNPQFQQNLPAGQPQSQASSPHPQPHQPQEQRVQQSVQGFPHSQPPSQNRPDPQQLSILPTPQLPAHSQQSAGNPNQPNPGQSHPQSPTQRNQIQPLQHPVPQQLGQQGPPGFQQSQNANQGGMPRDQSPAPEPGAPPQQQPQGGAGQRQIGGFQQPSYQQTPPQQPPVPNRQTPQPQIPSWPQQPHQQGQPQQPPAPNSHTPQPQIPSWQQQSHQQGQLQQPLAPNAQPPQLFGGSSRPAQAGSQTPQASQAAPHGFPAQGPANQPSHQQAQHHQQPAAGLQPAAGPQPAPEPQPPQLFGRLNDAAQGPSQTPQVPQPHGPPGFWGQGAANQPSNFASQMPQFPLPIPQPISQPNQMAQNQGINLSPAFPSHHSQPNQTPPPELPPPAMPSNQSAPGRNASDGPPSLPSPPRQAAPHPPSEHPAQNNWTWAPPVLHPAAQPNLDAGQGGGHAGMPVAGSQGRRSLADVLRQAANQAQPDAAIVNMVNNVLNNPLLRDLDIPAYPVSARARDEIRPANDTVTSMTLEELSNRVNRWTGIFGAPPQRQFTTENAAVVTRFLEQFRALEPRIITSIEEGRFTLDQVYNTPPFRQTLVEHLIALAFQVFVFFPFYPGLDMHACQILNNLTDDLYQNGASMKYDIEWRQAVCAKFSESVEPTVPAVQIMRTLRPVLEALYPQQGPILQQDWTEFAALVQHLVNLFRRMRVEKDFYHPVFPIAGSESTMYDISRTPQQGRIFLCTFPGLTRRYWDETARSWYEVLIVPSVVVLDGTET